MSIGKFTSSLTLISLLSVPANATDFSATYDHYINADGGGLTLRLEPDKQPVMTRVGFQVFPRDDRERRYGLTLDANYLLEVEDRWAGGQLGAGIGYRVMIDANVETLAGIDYPQFDASSEPFANFLASVRMGFSYVTLDCMVGSEEQLCNIGMGVRY
jgi:hypothetical protein|tara:strand:+ start:853 stop:1326 length:474 start_codon:yes stop_codon:yes gene_type:complete